jgi:hypothetical protein
VLVALDPDPSGALVRPASIPRPGKGRQGCRKFRPGFIEGVLPSF